MTQLKSKLTGLLALQFVIIVGIWTAQNSNQQELVKEPLVNAKSSEIDRLVITDGKETATLKKVGNEWQLPEFHNLAIEKTKITDLLDKLVKIKSGWAISTKSNSHERFEVLTDKFILPSKVRDFHERHFFHNQPDL